MGYLPAAGLPAPGQNAGTPPGRLTTGPTHSTIRQRRPQAPGRNEWLKVPHLRALTSGIHPPLMGSSGWYTVYLPQSPSGACIPGGRGHCLSIYHAAEERQRRHPRPPPLCNDGPGRVARCTLVTANFSVHQFTKKIIVGSAFSSSPETRVAPPALPNNALCACNTPEQSRLPPKPPPCRRRLSHA